MRSVVVVFVVVITFSCAAYSVSACSCAGPGAPCESFGSADAVFVGTAVSAKDNERPKQADRTDFDWAPRAFKFSVEQAYLGVAGTEVEVSTGYGGGDCGYQFKLGQRYLVYAYRYKDQLTTTICTRTKPFASANEDLAFLGTLPTAAPGVTIYGWVDNRELNEALSPDVLITIDGPERKEIHPDAEGRFRVSGLRAGDYKVSLRIPETLTTYEPQRELSIADRGCAALTWHLADNGRVSGRVVNPEGEPVARILVGLAEPGADPKDKYIKLEHTDDQGHFSFAGIPRGRYVIAVNHTRFPDPKSPSNAYPPSFYPGVVDQAQAQTITVGPGEKLNELEIRVPSKRAASVLKVKVVWADGTPVVNAQLSLRDVTQSESTADYGESADEQGQFRIDGYAGQTLVISARSNRPYTGSPAEPMERTEKARITLQRATETLRLVITKIR
jgi:hypothetical protein